MQHKLKQAQLADQVSFHVISGPDDILPNHNDKVRNRYRNVLNKRQVEVHTGFTVSQVTERCLHTADERTLELDYIIWATAATGAEWPAQAGLQTGPSGCIEVNDCLQSLSPEYFCLWRYCRHGQPSPAKSRCIRSTPG